MPPAPRRRRRRFVVLTTLALLAGLGGWALYLFQWRHAVAAPPVRARVKAKLEALPSGVRACWLETGKLLDNTASGLLVRHPQGDVLIDAGNSTRFAEEISVYHKTKWLWMKLVPGALVPSRSIADAITAVGADAGRLRWLLPTHAHLDHVGGVIDLPMSTAVLLPQSEIDWVNDARGKLVEGLIPAHVARLDGHMTPLTFVAQPYEIFDAHADLFGDGSVVVVPLAGHTPGSVGVFVNLSPSRRLFHVGDAVHDWRGLERGLSDPPILIDTNYDLAESERVVGVLAQLRRDAPELAFIPAHARRGWLAAFGDTPGRCIDGMP